MNEKFSRTLRLDDPCTGSELTLWLNGSSIFLANNGVLKLISMLEKESIKPCLNNEDFNTEYRLTDKLLVIVDHDFSVIKEGEPVHTVLQFWYDETVYIGVGLKKHELATEAKLLRKEMDAILGDRIKNHESVVFDEHSVEYKS